MKPMRILVITLLLLLASLSNGDAKDSSQWTLPENAIARIGKGRITDIAYSPDGKLLAMTTYIGTWLFDAKNGAELALLTGYTNEDFEGFSGNAAHESIISFSPDGKMLASVYWDGAVRVWDVQTRKLMTTLKGYWRSALFSPDGKILATSGILWDVNTFEQKSSLTKKRYSSEVALTFSPDGTTLITKGTGKTITLWDLKTKQSKTIEVGETSFLDSVVYSPDGTTIVCRGIRSNTVGMWDAKTAKQKAIHIGHTRIVNSVAYSPDGKTLASSCRDMIRLWNAKTGQHRIAIPQQGAPFIKVVFTPDGTSLTSASADGKIQLWDATTGQLKRTLIDGQNITSMLPSPDGKTLVTGVFGNIMLWDIDTQQLKSILTGGTDFATPAYFSQDGTTLTSVNSSIEHTKLLLWDLQTGKHQETFSKQQKNVSSRKLSPDGKILAINIRESGIQLWDTVTSEQKKTLTKQTGEFRTMEFSPDSSLFVTRDNQSTIELWDAATGNRKAVLTQFGGGTNALAFSPDGKVIASSTDHQARLWDLNSRTNIPSTFSTTGLMPGFLSLALSPDGTILASGSHDAKIRLWNIKTGLLMDTLIGHTGSIDSLAFLPKQKNTVAANSKNGTSSQIGTTLASRSRDGTVLLWRVRPFVETEAVVTITPPIVKSPNVGEQFTVNLDIEDGKNVCGFQLTLEFDSSALRYVSSENGNYLPSNAPLDVSVGPLWMHAPNRLSLVKSSSPNDAKDGSGILASVTFEVVAVKASTLSLPRIRLENRDGSLSQPIVIIGSVKKPSQMKDMPLDTTQLALPEGVKARLGKGTIYDIKFSPDNTQLAVASSIGIWLYDVNTGKELSLLVDNPAATHSITYSPNGKRLASNDSDRTVRVWNPVNGQLLKTFAGDHRWNDNLAIAFSPDGRTLAIGEQLWDIHTGQHKINLKWQHSYPVLAMTFSPDGKTLGTTTRQGNVRLWNAQTGQEIVSLHKGGEYYSQGHKLAFSQDGTRFGAIGSPRNRSNGSIMLWKTHTHELEKTVSEKNNSDIYVSIDFSSEGSAIAVVRKWIEKLCIRNIDTGEDIAVLEGLDEIVNFAAFSPDKTMLASAGSSGEIRIWDIETGKLRTKLTGYTRAVSSVTMLHNGTTLVTAHRDQPIQLWDSLTLQNKGVIQGERTPYAGSAVAFSPDGKTLAGGGYESLSLWDTNTLQKKVDLKGNRGEINTILFSPDGRTIAVGRYDKKIQLWNALTGEQTITLKGYAEQISSLAFSPDGATIASAETLSQDEHAIRLWNPKTGNLHTTIANLINPQRNQQLPVMDVAFSPDGKTVASIDLSTDIQLWDVETGKHKNTLTAHLNDIHSYYHENSALAFSPDGSTLVSTGNGASVNVWDVRTGKQQKALKGHTGLVTSLAYSEDGTTLVSGSADGTVLLWEMRKSPLTLLNITPFSIESPPAGTELTFMMNMTDGQNVNGYRFDLQYDATILRYIPNPENAPKIKNVKAAPPVIAENSITLAGKVSDGAIIEDGTIATVTFEVIKRADVTLTLTDALLTHKDREVSHPIVGHAWVVEPPRIPEDANRDWQLDAADLEFVSTRLGQTGKDNSADVNKDGIVDLADLVLVRNALYGLEPESETD